MTMLPPRLLLRRIPGLIRPLRPPRQNGSNPKLAAARMFSSNAQLLLLSSPRTRPQLPFLHSPSGHPSSAVLSNHLRNPTAFRHGVPRLISTERRKKITDGLKVAFTAYALVLLFYIMKMGLYQEKIERMYPTPPEWSLMSRWYLRSARAKQDPIKFGKIFTDWVTVGCYYEDLIARMEDPAIDGKGIKEQEGGAALIEGVGKAGYDIEDMSEAWKTGYFQILMGAGESAEKLDGWVTDTVVKASSPPEYVVGPSNPYPRPLPPGAKNVIREENCVPAYQSPEVFYMKILTTKGFKPNQKLDAAIAYADWLDFKGLKETSGHVYNWVLDIASAGLPVDAGKVVNKDTGVLSNSASEHVTENLLRASTANGVHQVRCGNLPNALPIFLSVLRARRNLPTSLPSESIDKKGDGSILTSISETLLSYLIPPPYPLSTRTGNEQPVRSPAAACEEAGLMVYIGEIIFSSSSQENGLSWTRDAVDLAESTLMHINDENEQWHRDVTHGLSTASSSSSMNHADAQERCRDCLKAGLDNWKVMMRKLVVKSENEELDAMEKAKGSWFGGSRSIRRKELQRKRWEAEEAILKDRAKRLRYIVGDTAYSEMGSASILFN